MPNFLEDSIVNKWFRAVHNPTGVTVVLRAISIAGGYVKLELNHIPMNMIFIIECVDFENNYTVTSLCEPLYV